MGVKEDYVDKILGDESLSSYPKKFVTIDKLPEHIQRYLQRLFDRGKIEPKQCYHNAFFVLEADPEIEYIEGVFSFHGVPVEHAWNCYKGMHFDATSHFLHKDKISSQPPEKNYVEIQRSSDRFEVFGWVQDVISAIVRVMRDRRKK